MVFQQLIGHLNSLPWRWAMKREKKNLMKNKRGISNNKVGSDQYLTGVTVWHGPCLCYCASPAWDTLQYWETGSFRSDDIRVGWESISADLLSCLLVFKVERRSGPPVDTLAVLLSDILHLPHPASCGNLKPAKQSFLTQSQMQFIQTAFSFCR